MNCYYIFLTFTLLISNAFDHILNRLSLCTAIHSCEETPVRTAIGIYIGVTYQSCKPMICEKYKSDKCLAYDERGHYLSTGVYINCYSENEFTINDRSKNNIS